MNHDKLFKKLFERPVVLKGFFEAFLPQVAAFIDFTRMELVDKEGATYDDQSRIGDLLVKTGFRGKPAAFLIHVEHQAQPDPNLGWRMMEYWLMYWRKFRLPVYPIAVLSHRRSGTRPASPLEIHFPNKRVLEFDFDVIDLAAMNAESYIRMRNPAALALAARMKTNPQKRVDFSRSFLLNLSRTPVNAEDQQTILEFFAEYQPLSAEEALQLEGELGKVTPDATREAVMNFKSAFIELGKQRGFQQGQSQLVIRQLTRRLGALSSSQTKAIRDLPPDKLEALGEALLDLTSSADLNKWLRSQKPRKTA